MACVVALGRYRKNTALASVLALALSSSALLPGCTDPATRSQIDITSQSTRAGLDEATRPSLPAKRYNPLVVSDKVWTGNTAQRMHRGVPLPEKYETSRGVTVVSAVPMTLDDIVKDVEQQTGIPFHVADVGGGRRASPDPSSSSPAPSGPSMPVSYEGSLSGLLERLSGNFGINWRYDGSTISITRFETRVFTVEALPGTQQVQDGMQDDTNSGSSSSSGGSGGSSGGGSSSSSSSITQNSKFSIDIKYWDELDKVIVSMLAGTGTVVVSPSLGTVTVTTTPEIMRTVSNYLEQENQRISRQIAVNVEIYSVTLTKGMDFNVAFNTALRRLTNFGGNFSGASAPTDVTSFTGGGALSLAILNNRQISNLGDGQNITHPPGEITDVFKALSGIGDTTKVAKFPLITLNNRPVSRRIGQDINYVYSATSNTSGAGTTSTFSGTSLVPGTVHQGFSVQLTPRLLDDGRILLQYSLSIIDVLGMDSFNSICGSSTTASASCTANAAGSSTVQLPKTANRIFVQQSVLKSGSTLILGGAEEDDAQQNAQGVGDPNFYGLGGGLSSGASHAMLFFALTPQVLDIPHSEQE